MNLGPQEAGEGGTGDCVGSLRLACVGLTMPALRLYGVPEAGVCSSDRACASPFLAVLLDCQ